MNVTTFISPLDTVQLFSIFSYVNTLSDFLFAENFLNENDQHKHIPIVNALYNYLDEDKKLPLVKKLINNTDLFGSKENEIPDSKFIDTLLNHIVSTLVFDKFTNVYGFIAETIRYTTNDSLNYLMQRLKKSLIDLRFENEYGDPSKLDSNAVNIIFRNMIEPLFPYSANHSLRITSIDYIYAQAGRMFLKSGETSSETKNSPNQFQEYIETAHTVEQLVLAKKINETVLKIFALPALINYFYEKVKLNYGTTISIINSPKHWMEAYTILFSRLNYEFATIEEKQKEDYRYQFYLALSSIKNRTTLARETIEMNCDFDENKLESEVWRYKNNPSSYDCGNGTLGDLNQNFQYLINNITARYYNYEKESCREALGSAFGNLKSEDIVITKGLIHYPLGVPFGLEITAHQLTRPSDDLFEFYFPENGTYLYFALIRKDYNVTLIEEKSNPILFRKRLGLKEEESFEDKYFTVSMKKQEENFERFLSRIAEERSKQFAINLKAREYDETTMEWWKDFGLSLIPFYSCVTNIRDQNELNAEISCPLDVLFFIPLVGEVGALAGKMTSTAMKASLALSETTIRTITLRASLRTALSITGRVLVTEMESFRIAFKNIGVAALRFIDPGFELMFQLGKGGLGLIRKMLVRVEKKHLTTFGTMKAMLDKTQRAIVDFPKRVGKLFGRDIYVNSLVGGESAYGYRYIPLRDGKLAEIRTVYPKKRRLALTRTSSSEIPQARQVYSKVDVETEKIISDEFFLEEEEGFLVSEEGHYETNIIDKGGDGEVEGLFVPNLIKNINSRKMLLTEAVDLGTKNRIPEMKVRNELKKYAFPADRTEINFVQDWVKNTQMKPPTWAEEYKISKPEIFSNLKYRIVMENPDISLKQAKSKIEALYPNHRELYQQLPIDQVYKDFKNRKAYNQVNFEDYYALRNYGASGYKKMAENCDEAKRMKNAIYRLAIRQSEDTCEECVQKLFRGEARLTETIEKELYPERKDYELNRFTSTSTDFHIADIYSDSDNPSLTKVIYTINFDESYLRARVEDLFVLKESETILLPGTKFKINSIVRGETIKPFGTQKTINVELSIEKITKVEAQQRIMKEIEKLMEGDTVFYA